MLKTTYYKVEKKLLKQIKSDLDAIISFEKKMAETLKKNNIKGVSLMEGADRNTSRLRRDILELLRDSKRIIKE